MQLVNHQTKTLILLLSSIAIRLSVRLSVRSKTTCHKIFCTITVVVPRPSSDDNAICYVLPVLWMTSYFPTIWHMWFTTRLITAEGCQSALSRRKRREGRGFSVEAPPLWVAFHWLTFLGRKHRRTQRSSRTCSPYKRETNTIKYLRL